MRKSLYLVVQAGWNGVFTEAIGLSQCLYPAACAIASASDKERHPRCEAVGRLDQDTTGLLLLSDDGQFIHRMTSPKKHVPKVYEVTTKHPVDARQISKLLEGVVLDDDPTAVKAAGAELIGSHQLKLTLLEGKYHQVKRMLAAVGNRVEQLHRSQIGALELPESLKPGEWMWLGKEHLRDLGFQG